MNPPSPPPRTGRPAYIPQLDGLRGWGMLLVILAHLPRPSDSLPLSLVWQAEHATKLADIALDAFFVMSGFLITRLLLAERRTTGRIDLPAFYYRRSLRIFPIYYLAILVVTLCWPTTLDRTAALVTYTYNLYLPFHPVPYPLEQSWSLAVEEQFYLLWPMLLILLPPRWLGRTTLVLIPAAALLAAITLAATAPPAIAAGLTYMSLPTRMLPIALGCFLAVMEEQGRTVSLRQAAASATIGAVILGAAVFGRAHGLLPPGGWYWTLILPGVTLMSFGAIVTLLSPATPRWLVFAFKLAPARFLGRISYAAYLIHVPLLFALGINDAALDGGPAPWRRSALVVVLTIALAAGSLFLIERPLSRLRSRNARPPLPQNAPKATPAG